MAKVFGKMKQWTGEKVGGAQKTETGEDFRRLQHETEVRKDAIEKLHDATSIYLKSLSKKKDTCLDGKNKRMPIEIFGLGMVNFGNMLHEDSAYGKCLVDFNECCQEIAVAQMDFVSKVRNGFAANLSHVLVEIKDYQNLKKKLEGRRLDFDAKLNKVSKAKKEKPELEEETRVAQMKYEDTLNDITTKMLALNSNEDIQLDDLLNFVDAQYEYFSRGIQLCEKLQKTFQHIPRQTNRKPLPLNRTLSASPTQVSAGGHERTSSTSSRDPRASRSEPPAARSSDNRYDSRYENNRNDNRHDNRNDDYRNSQEENGRKAVSPQRSNHFNATQEEDTRNFAADASYNSIDYNSSTNSNDSRFKNSANPAPKVVGGFKKVRVLYDFRAEGPGELSISKGQVINMIAEIDEGWWEGEDSDGNKGMFPSNYVEGIPDDSASRPKPNPPKNLNASMSKPALGNSFNNGSSAVNLSGSLSHSRNSTNGPAMVMPSRRESEVAATPACSQCGCEDFRVNAFKPGQCVSCFHKH